MQQTIILPIVPSCYVSHLSPMAIMPEVEWSIMQQEVAMKQLSLQTTAERGRKGVATTPV
jgi:aromatic ring-opening dioxygenase catalytic subunit (LigB family)